MNDIGFPKPEKIFPTDRLELRYRHLEDAKLCFELIDASRDHLAPWMPWEEETTKVSDSENYFKLAQEHWDKAKMFDFSLFLKGTSTLIGSAGIHTINWQNRACDLGYWLGAKYEGQGYASEATKALETIARKLGFHKIQITCDPKNKKSSAVAERLGYLLESYSIDDLCIDGKYRDTLRFVKLINPEVPGFITDNFPRGYGLKKVDAEEFMKARHNFENRGYEGSLLISDNSIMEFKTPESSFNKFLKIYYLLYFENELAGWCYGHQTQTDTFDMADTVILKKHQGRKLYSRILETVIGDCKRLGFLKITSLHQITHSHIISAKLKRGFKVTGTNMNLYAGTMLELSYFIKPLREKVLKFRSGELYPDQELKEIFKM